MHFRSLKILYGLRHAKACLREYADNIKSRSACTPVAGHSISENRIVGYFRMYEQTATARMILCACAGWSVRIFAHVWKQIFAWRGQNHYENMLYNVDTLKPHFVKAKTRVFTGVYIIALISAQKHRLWVIYVLSGNTKHIRYFIWKFSFLGGKIFNVFE